MITGTTQLLGVIGHPVTHSLSPVMHNAALQALGRDLVYLPLPVRPADLAIAVAGFGAIGLVGFNVTIPHKQAIMPLLTEISEVAQAVGAVNTVWQTEAGWHGTNTDVLGFLAPLQAMARAWAEAPAVVLGNGGAARAVVVGCAQLGCGAIQVVGRNPAKLTAFRESWAGFPPAKLVQVHDWAQLAQLLPTAALVVNTTPVGMHPHPDQMPLTVEQIAQLSPDCVVYDLIYTPRPTRLLQQAAAQGCPTLDGAEMLVQQGAAALELWLQQPVPVEVMRQALLNATTKP